MNNSFIATNKILDEYTHAMVQNRTHKIRHAFLACLAAYMVFFIIIILTGNFNFYYAAPFVFFLILSLALLPLKRKPVKNDISEPAETYEKHDDPEIIESNITDDGIAVLSGDDANEVFKWSSIKSYFETENLFILPTIHGGIILLEKNSFTDGSAEECRVLLNKYIKKGGGKK